MGVECAVVSSFGQVIHLHYLPADSERLAFFLFLECSHTLLWAALHSFRILVLENFCNEFQNWSMHKTPQCSIPYAHLHFPHLAFDVADGH